MAKLKVGILISGRGSNMAALIKAAAAADYPAEIAVVVSNVADAAGLDIARGAGIATSAIPHKAYPDRESFDRAVSAELEKHDVQLVALAGFMRILGANFVQHYAHRLLNIHPSLLPAFPGLNTHQRALDAGCKVAGATVHWVTAELDHGPIVMQSVVPVYAQDDAHTLAERVLQTEHVIYPQSVRWWVQDELVLQDGRVRHRAGADQTFWATV